MYKKIDIYLKDLKGFYQYECSTNWRKTCKDAKKRFLQINPYLHENQVKAKFSK